MKNRILSRKLILTLLAHAGSAYLIRLGHVEEAAFLSGIAQGTYNIGQGIADNGAPRLRSTDRSHADFLREF